MSAPRAPTTTVSPLVATDLAKIITRSAIGGRQLLLQAPHAAAAREDIRGTGIVSLHRVVAEGADHQRVAEHRHRRAKLVARGCVGGGQLLLQRHLPLIAHENVSRARVQAGQVVIRRPDDDRGPVNGGRGPERIQPGVLVRGDQLLPLRPGGAVIGEHVGRTGVEFRPAVLGAAHQHRRAADGDRVAEHGRGQRVGSGQLRLLAERPATPREHVSRTDIRPGGRVIQPGSNHGRVASQSHGITKLVRAQGVVARETLLLRPNCTVASEHIGRPRIGTRGGVVPGCADQDRVGTDRHGNAELVQGRPVRGDQLLLMAPAPPLVVYTYAAPTSALAPASLA